MPEVVLVLNADNSKHIQKIKEAQAATQKLYDEKVKGEAQTISMLEKEIAVMNRLKAEKQKATKENKAAYDAEIVASRKRMVAYQEAEKVAKETNKTIKDTSKSITDATNKTPASGGGLVSTLKNWAIGFASVTATVETFKFILESTDRLGDQFKATLNGWKEGFSAMARAIANNDFKNFFKDVRAAVDEGQRFSLQEDKISDAERALKLRVDERLTSIQKLRVEQQNQTNSETQRLEAGKEAERLLQENADDEVKIAKMRVDNILQLSAVQAGFRGKEIENGKILIEKYLQQEPVLMRQIEIGLKYNELLKDRERLAVPLDTTGIAPSRVADLIEQRKKERAEVEKNIVLLGGEAEGYRKLAIGLTSVIDPIKDQIIARKSAIGEAERSALNLRVLGRNDSLEAAMGKDKTAAMKKEYDQRIEDTNKYNDLVKKLDDDLAKANIESLKGVDKLRAERDLGLKKIDEARAELASVGKLTPEIDAKFAQLGGFVWTAFVDGITKEMKKNPIEVIPLVLKDQQKRLEDEIAKQKIKFDIIPEVGIDTASIDTTQLTEDQKLLVEKLKNTNELQKAIPIPINLTPEVLMKGYPDLDKLVKGPKMPAKPTKPIGSMWELIGLDPDNPKDAEMIAQITEAKDTVLGIMNDIYDARVEDAQRTRELLDTRIAEAQQALETEQELQKKGYASNVELKKKELETLQAQRVLALKQEEEALKKQRILDAAQQSAALIVSSVNIIKSQSKFGFLGILTSVAMIAGLYKIFASAKQQAAAATKLEKGGFGEVHGRRHYQGGERFTDNIEVEDSEKWGVLSRPASRKYGKAFYKVVEGFNKDNHILINKAFNILNPDFAGGQTIENHAEYKSLIDKRTLITNQIKNISTNDTTISKNDTSIVNNDTVNQLKTELSNIDNRIENIKNDTLKVFNDRLLFEKVSPDVLKPEIKNNISIDNTGPNKRLDTLNQSVKELKKQPVKETILMTESNTVIIKGQTTRKIRR